MSPIFIGIIGFLILFCLLAIKYPVGFGMGLVGFLGFWILISFPSAFNKLSVVSFDIASNYSLAALPLFILMAHVTFASGISKDLFILAAKWFGNFRGGLAIATIGGCAGFAAVSASSLATAATMGLVAIPEMKKHNYSDELSTGCIAAGGTLGVLIPPSGILIVYGVLTEQSIGKLFMAGVIPGILEALFYIITITILCTYKPSLGPRGPKYSFTEKMAAFKSCGEIILLIFLVLGGLLLGWFTPTESGAVGAFGAILFSCIRRRLTLNKFKEAIKDTLKNSGMLYGILIGAFIFNYFVAVTNIPSELATYVGGLELHPVVILGLVIVTYIILGCFLDPSAMILLTIPVFYPLALDLGFDPIWFGIVVVRAGEIAGITPPVGMNVYVISGVAPDVPLTTIFKGALPFVIADFFHMAMILFIPSVVLYLPSLVS